MTASNRAAEEALLSALLADNAARSRCGLLEVAHFDNQEFGKIFGAAIDLIDQGQPVSPTILAGLGFNLHLLADLAETRIEPVFVEICSTAIQHAHAARKHHIPQSGVREMPQNIQAEQALLGALLANNAALSRVPFLKPEHFADPVHGLIYRSIINRAQAGKLADAVTLKAEFEHSGILKDVGGTAYLADLLAHMVSIAGASEYGWAVYDTWSRRTEIVVGNSLISNAFGDNPDITPEQNARSALDALAPFTMDVTTRRLKPAEAADAIFNDAQAAFQGEVGSAYRTGLGPLDRVFGGFWPGELYYLVARPNHGKSSVLAQIARELATQGSKVIIFSLEMDVKAWTYVNFAGLGRWSVSQLREGHIGDAEAWLELERIRERVKLLPIDLREGRIDLPTFRQQARIAVRNGAEIIFVDYLDLMGRTERHLRMPEREFVLEVCYDTKDLAKELGIPVICARQSNKGDDAPALDDIPYENGRAADVAVSLYREDIGMGDKPKDVHLIRDDGKRIEAIYKHEQEKRSKVGLARLTTVKARLGTRPSVQMRFVGARMSLVEDTILRQDDMFAEA